MKRAALNRSGPRIGEAMGWRQVNGWEKLRRIIGSIPNAIPHTFTIKTRTQGNGIDSDHESVGTGNVLIPPECDFYCLATTVAGVAGIGTPTVVGLGSGPQRDQPECFLATVMIQYESGGFRWSNMPVRVGHIFGTGARPYLWPAPWIIPAGTTIQATVTAREATAALQDTYLNFVGFKLFKTAPPLATDVIYSPRILDVIRRAKLARGGVRVEPYVYALNFDTLQKGPSTFGLRVPHGAEQQTFSVSEADFALVEQMGVIDRRVEAISLIETSPTTSVKLTLDVGRRRLDDRPMPFQSVFGSAKRPFRYGYPVVIPRGGNLTAFIQFGESSTSIAQKVASNAYLTFSGVRIFPESFR